MRIVNASIKLRLHESWISILRWSEPSIEPKFSVNISKNSTFHRLLVYSRVTVDGNRKRCTSIVSSTSNVQTQPLWMTDGNHWCIWMSTYTRTHMHGHTCLSKYRFQNNNNCEHHNDNGFCLILYIHLNCTVWRHSFIQNECSHEVNFFNYVFLICFLLWLKGEGIRLTFSETKNQWFIYIPSILLIYITWDSSMKTMLILSIYLLFLTIIGDNVIHAYKPVR